MVPVLVEAVHDQVFALHPLDQPERPAPHHRLRLAAPPIIERVLLRRGRRVEHQAHAVRGQHVQHEAVRVLEPDLHGGRIEDFDRVNHRLVVSPHAGLGRRIDDAVDAELDGGGVHLGAVVEQDVLSELERVEQPVGRDVPRLGGIRDERAVGRDPEQAAPDVHRHPVQLVSGRGVKVEVGDLVAVRDPQGAAPLGHLRLRDGGGHDDRPNERNDGDDGGTENTVSRAHGASLLPTGSSERAINSERDRRVLYRKPSLSTTAGFAPANRPSPPVFGQPS